MKVLHLISSGGLYGAEAVILNLSQALNAKGDQSLVGVFAHDGVPEPMLHEAARSIGVTSELVPCHGQLDFNVGDRIRELVQRHDITIVHAHGYKADIYAALAFAGRRRPVLVSTCHTWYDNDLAVRLYGALDRVVLRGFDEVVAVSEEVRQRLLAAGVQADRVSLVRNGVDVPRQEFQPEERQRSLPSRLRVGLVGRLAPEKGVDLFLQAAARLRGGYPEAEFLVAGHGPERERLQSQLQALGLQGRVSLLGGVQDMTAFYRSLDLLVSASRQEGLPMALLEGMAHGLPVVATRVGEVPQVVQEGITGTLIPPAAVNELATAIGDLLQNPDRRRDFGRAAEQRIRDHFSSQRMTTDYVEVYRRALARHRSGPIAASAGSRAA